MKRFGFLLCGLVCGLALVSGAASANAGMIFATNFDNTFDRTLNPLYVGSGVLSFDEMLADGTYLLSSLTNLAFSFTVGGETFTLADLSASTASLGLTVYQSGTDFYFDGPVAPTSFFFAAFEFTNSNGAMIGFEPNDVGNIPPCNMYRAFTPTDMFLGTYGVNASVPEPGTLTLCAFGGLGCVVAAWRRRRATAG